MRQDSDTIDVRDLLRVLRSGIPWIAGGAVVGVALALLVTRFLPTQFEASASVVLRSQVESPLDPGRLGGLGALGGLGSIFSSGSGFETEMQVLTSRMVVGEVVDSLGLRLRVTAGRTARPDSVFSSVRIDPRAVGARYRFRRDGQRFQVEGGGVATTAEAGSLLVLPGLTVVIDPGHAPNAFVAEVMDREDAIADVRERLQVRRVGGEMASVTYRDADPRLAAAVPNLLLVRYLERRRTSDRGVNQRRYDFLLSATDSVAAELQVAEVALRAHQEASGTIEPAARGQVELERAMALRGQVEKAEIEARTLREILARSDAGTLRSHDLVAHPGFIGNAAINDLLSRLLDVETQRAELARRRTPTDPDLRDLEELRSALESQLSSLSRSYLDGLERQRTEVRREMSGYEASLAQLPGTAQQSLRLQREVRRLSETMLAMQSQLIAARLAAMGEGGDVRQVDVAVAPREPASPRPLLNASVGGFAGGLLGLVFVFGLTLLGQRVREPRAVERALGVPVLAFDRGAPLLLADGERGGTVLVVPVGASACGVSIARGLADTAYVRGLPVALLEFAPPGAAASALPAAAPTPTPATPEVGFDPELFEAAPSTTYRILRVRASVGPPSGLRRAVEELERVYAPVIAVVPSLEDVSTTALLSPSRSVILAAHKHRATRAVIEDAFGALQRLGIPVAGVVLHNGEVGE